MNNKIIHIEANEKSNAIQKAINSLNQAGGMISLKAGTHLSKPIILKSDVVLHLEKDAELQFSDNFSDYPTRWTRWEGTECHALQSMIFAENCSHVKIIGDGTINGLGRKWWQAYINLRNDIASKEVKAIQKKLSVLNENVQGGSGGGGRETNFLRPSLIQFKDCSEITIEGVTLKDSPFWNTHILYCSDVHLKNLTFLNPSDAPNTDGLDIDSSSKVSVEDCFFDVGDDCLCLKSGMDKSGININRPTSDVQIRNCTMENGHGAVVLGSETSGGIKNVMISDCKMLGTDRGIRIKTRRGRGGIIENISINNILMNDVIAPIVINMYYRCGADESEIDMLKSLQPGKTDIKKTPVIRNIEINNIRAENVKSSSAFFLGLPESRISNINIKNYRVIPALSTTVEEPAMDLFFTKSDSPRLLYKNIENLQIENLTIKSMDRDFIDELLLPEDTKC